MKLVVQIERRHYQRRGWRYEGDTEEEKEESSAQSRRRKRKWNSGRGLAPPEEEALFPCLK